jgi:hypothetical protein
MTSDRRLLRLTFSMCYRSGMRTVRNLLVIVAGVVFIVFAMGSAVQAHHPLIVGSPSCVNPVGGFTVTWTVTPDVVRGLTWTIDGVTKPDSEAFTFTSAHNLEGPVPMLTKFATWSNGATGTATGTSVKPERCTTPTTTTTTATTTTTMVDPTTTTTTTTVPATTTTAISDESSTTNVPTTIGTTVVLPSTGAGSAALFAFGWSFVFLGGAVAMWAVRRP